MKIGFVCDDSLDTTDGVQQYMLTVSHWLRRQGHDVHFLVGQTKRHDIPYVHSLSKNVPIRYNQNRLSVPLPADVARIRQLLTSEQYDVLHIQMPYSPQLAGRIIRESLPSTAVVGTFHILPYSRQEQLATHLLGRWLRSTLRRFDAVCSVSEAARAFAERALGIRSSVIPNCVDIKTFRQSQRHSGDKINLVFLGRLVARKGCRQLLQAIAVLPPHMQQNITVSVGGKGPELRALQDYVTQAGLSSCVTFAGFIDEDNKAAFLGGADIAIFPSLSGESFGIVLIEAMAAGAGVVVGGNNPGYACVLDDEPAELFDPRNTRAFADFLARLINEPALRSHLHTMQQQRIKQYDVNVVGSQIMEMYQTAIAKRKAYIG